MKKIAVFLCVFICMTAGGAHSLDMELAGGLGNLAFYDGRTTALSDGDTGPFSPSLFPLILARFSGKYKDIDYNAGFERGPIIRNRLFAGIKVDLDHFFLEAGPFIGLFNSAKLILNPGISTALGLQFPGIIYIRAMGSSTLGIPMDVTGNYSQLTGDMSIGFWVPYVVCSLNVRVQNFALREQGNLLIEDNLARYFFSADVYTKNVPYTVRVDLGYQDLSRSYISQKINNDELLRDTQKDEFKSVFVGLEGSYSITPELKVLLGGEMPVYYWGVRPMKDPPKKTVLFEVRAGVMMKLTDK